MLNGLPPDSMNVLRSALEGLVVPEEEAETEVEEVAAAPEVEAAGDEDVVLRDAFTDTPEEAVAAAPPPHKGFQPVPVETVAFDEDDDVDFVQGKNKKKGKKKGRQLVFDEKRGGMVVKRQRKGNRGRGNDWNNWEE
jgi:hypothetical protein